MIQIAWCVGIGFGLAGAAGAAGPETITKTGDVLTFAGQTLLMDNSKLVPDAAAPGGQAVEGQGKRWFVVHVTLPPVPAGRYDIVARVRISQRRKPGPVGRLIVNPGTGQPVDDVTRPFAVEDFAQAEGYQDFGVTVVCAPGEKGRCRPVVQVMHEDPAVGLRVAAVVVRAQDVGPAVVYRVWPEKLLCRPRADQPITVAVANTTDRTLTGLKLKLELVHGLGQVEPVAVREVALKPYETAELVFPWNTGEREYGYEAVATLMGAQGEVLSRLSEYFAVSRSHFKLRIFGSARWLGSFLDKNSMLQGAMGLRRTYGNYVEVYGWPPSAFVELYPRQRFWSSGQVCEWQYDREVMKAWIDEMHRLGLWVTAYNISLFNGWPGVEAMRRHPEWCAFNELGRPIGGVNTGHACTKEAAYGEDKPPVRVPFIGEMPNHGAIWPLADDLLRQAANEIVMIHQKLGFDGMRWDGHPIVYVLQEPGGILGTEFGRMIWRYDGKSVVELLPDRDLDSRSLHNMRLIKETVRQAAPDFQWGYNAGYDLTAEQQPRTWKEVVQDAGIWVEGGFRSGDEARADPTNTWARYMDKLYLSSQFVIRAGGYPIHGALAADTTVMRRFLNVIFLAQGSHAAWHGGTWGEYIDLSRFATRYCQYLFDPAIHPWWGYPDIHVTGWVTWADRRAAAVPPLESEARLRAPRPLFFPEKMLFHREGPAGQKDTILHLVNHPGKPYVDYTEMTPPAVQQDIEVQLRVPAGMKAREAWCLSPDGWPLEQRLRVEPAGAGWIKLVVPRLAFWDIVVVNWVKEG